MTPTAVFDSYWRFAAERQTIFFKRLSNSQGPWTHDPILSSYRFTNVYRASDRVSQYLIREIQYHPDRVSDPNEVFFRTLLFKMFNKIETWESLESRFGPLSWRTIDLNAIDHFLHDLLDKGQKIYSAAYIMPAPKFGHKRKHSNHLALLRAMMDDQIPARVCQSQTLGDVNSLLLSYSGIGPFLAFQYTIDLNYSEMLDFSEASFVVAGPGALDGIAKCFEDIGRLKPEEVIFEVAAGQDRAFSNLDLSFQSLFGRPLQPIDCQNLFCEISKYARVAHPDVLGTTGRTRIKQSYNPTSRLLPTPFYPPSWGLKIR